MSIPTPIQLMQQTRLYLCTDARREKGDFADFVDAAYRGGVDVIQLRDTTLDAREELDYFELLAAAAQRHGRLFAANDRADIAALTQAPVLHLGQRDLPAASARKLLERLDLPVVIGRSNNSVELAAASREDPDVDYYTIGPVWPTPTKPGRPAVGVDAVAQVARQAKGNPKPWFAIGDIHAGNIDAVIAAGATRVVVVRAITQAEDPEAAALLLREHLG